MNFYSVLKYVLMVVFLGIIAVAFLNMPSSDAPTNQPIVQQPQTKFNF